MNENIAPISEQPLIEKYVVSSHNEIQTHNLSRCAIGYILYGEKYIYYGDKCYKFSKGDLFFLGMGCHYIKDTPEEQHPYEQIIVYYSAAELQRIVLNLNFVYQLTITNAHQCEKCRTLNHAVMPGWNAIHNLFTQINTCLRDELFQKDRIVENIKITELLYLVANHEDCCLKNKLLSNVDIARDNFQQIVGTHIFIDISVEEMARLSNRSLTSFKKEFHRIYGTSPHQWFIHQRLIHARLLLISTEKSISEVGTACAFPNTSHFIKLFKKQYEMTPAGYRTRYHGRKGVLPEEGKPTRSAEPIEEHRMPEKVL